MSASDQGLGGAPGAPPAPADDPRIAQYAAELAAANATIAQYEGVLTPLQEHKQLIEEILNDEEARELYNNVKQGREAFKKTQVKPIPEELQPLVEKLDRVAGYVDKLEKGTAAQEAQAKVARETAAKAWSDSATTYITGTLAKTVPGYLTGKKYANGDDELTDEGLMMVNAVSTYANKHNISFEEAYKRVGDRFAPRGGASAPPSSLPVDAASPGIPGPAKPTTGDVVDFASELERRMAAGATG